jgi:hypothetical protein
MTDENQETIAATRSMADDPIVSRLNPCRNVEL